MLHTRQWCFSISSSECLFINQLPTYLMTRCPKRISSGMELLLIYFTPLWNSPAEIVTRHIWSNHLDKYQGAETSFSSCRQLAVQAWTKSWALWWLSSWLNKKHSSLSLHQNWWPVLLPLLCPLLLPPTFKSSMARGPWVGGGTTTFFDQILYLFTNLFPLIIEYFPCSGCWG